MDQGTTVPGTGSATWNVTFTDGTYMFFCDMHPIDHARELHGGRPDVDQLDDIDHDHHAPPRRRRYQHDYDADHHDRTDDSDDHDSDNHDDDRASDDDLTGAHDDHDDGADDLDDPTRADDFHHPTKVVAAMAVQSLRVVARAAAPLACSSSASTSRRRAPSASACSAAAHALATLRSRIGARPTTLRLHVPASAPAGRYTIEVVAGSGPTAKRVLRSVRLRG